MVILCPHCKTQNESEKFQTGTVVECGACGYQWIVRSLIKRVTAVVASACMLVGVVAGIVVSSGAQEVTDSASQASAVERLKWSRTQWYQWFQQQRFDEIKDELAYIRGYRNSTIQGDITVYFDDRPIKVAVTTYPENQSEYAESMRRAVRLLGKVMPGLNERLNQAINNDYGAQLLKQGRVDVIGDTGYAIGGQWPNGLWVKKKADQRHQH